MPPPPTPCSIDDIVLSLIHLDDQLTGLDLDFSIRQQYIHTVELYLGNTKEGIYLQHLVHSCSIQSNENDTTGKHEQGVRARNFLHEIIQSIPPINAKAPPHPSPEEHTAAIENNGNEDDVGGNHIELQLLEHMTIEEKQLRPITIALCCSVLFQTWNNNKRLSHLERSVPWLLHKCLFTFPRQDLSMYATADPTEFRLASDVEEKAEAVEAKERSAAANFDYSIHSTPQTGLVKQLHPVPPTLSELLSSIPYCTIVRTLEPEVEQLIRQRQLLEEAQKHALARREARKRAILRTAAKWQQNSRHSYFIHWANIAALLKKQRKKLVSKFVTMKAPTLKMIFDGWQ